MIEVIGDVIHFIAKFEDPGKVSIGSQRDVMITEILDESFFCDKDSGEALAEGTQIINILPRMLAG